MKKNLSYLAVAATALGAMGCAVSDMEVLRASKILGRPPEEVIFHFEGGLNMAMIIGRSLALLALAFWFFNSERRAQKKVLTLVFGVPLTVAALWLFAKDWQVVTQFRIEVLDGGLMMRVPPEPELRVDWKDVVGMEIKGVQYGWNVDPSGVNPSFTVSPSWEEWHSMELLLADGRTYSLNLKPISPEQRRQIWESIKFRADLHFNQ